jgi:hypothetical protein
MGVKNMQCFRVRAAVFASAHGRPNGMPGRSIGARAKALRSRDKGEHFEAEARTNLGAIATKRR